MSTIIARAYLVALLATCALLASCVATPRAEAQAPVEAVATLDRQQTLLGERVRLAVIVVHPSDVLVNVDPPVRSAVLQLAEVVPRAVTPNGPTSETRFEYVIAAFQLGEMRLASSRVTWLRADGESGELMAAPPPLMVNAASNVSDTELRPLKPQLEAAGAPAWWQTARALAAAGALLVTLLLLVAFVVWLRRRPAAREVQVAAGEASASVENEARQRLEVLAAEAPLVRGDYDAYYGTISAVVRDYLQERFAFGARALTTTELQRRMVALGVERWQARLVAGLLDRCDAAVYAGRHPDPASADHDLTVAFEIVELSRPDEPEPVAAGAAR